METVEDASFAVVEQTQDGGALKTNLLLVGNNDGNNDETT
jgi:hypothetical protein